MGSKKPPANQSAFPENNPGPLKKPESCEPPYRKIFESMLQGMIIQDAEGKVITANPAALDMLGVPLDGLTGRTLEDLPWSALKENGKVLSAENSLFRPVIQTGQAVTNVAIKAFNPQSNQYRWLLVSVSPLFRNQPDQPFQLFTTFYDVTEYWQKHDATRHKEESFRSLIQNSTDLISVLDRQGRILSTSPSAQRILGFTPSQLLETSFFDLLHPDDRTLFKQFFLLKTRLPRAVSSLPPYRFQRKDGSYVYLESVVNNLLSEPTVQGVVLNSRDVTDRKSMEDALRQSERDKETILSGMTELLSYQDRDLTVQWVNRATSDTLNASGDELVGRKCYLMWPGQKEICPGCPVTEAMACGETCESEVVTADGKTWWVRGNPVTDHQDRIIGAVELRLDITERKIQEEKIRYLTFHDSLTGLYNRLFFETELTRLDTARQLPLTMVIADINGLKLVNDAFGHDKGDSLLLRASELLRQSCRREDILARWGGDEFFILLPRTGKSTAQKIIKRIEKQCRPSEDLPIPISIALGAATKHSPEEPIRKIMKLAEDRMYRQKRTESRKTRKIIFEALKKTLRELTREQENTIQPILVTAQALGRILHLSQKEMEELELLVLFRNLGKIALPRETANKTGDFTRLEWEALQTHPEIGYRIAQSTPELAPIAEEILTHHEAWNGSGYPQGLIGKEIPLLSRILVVAEAYIKLQLETYHKQPLSREEALKAIQQKSGTSFDPEITEALTQISSHIPEPLE